MTQMITSPVEKLMAGREAWRLKAAARWRSAAKAASAASNADGLDGDPMKAIARHPLVRICALLRPFAGEITLAVCFGAATIAAGIALMATSAYIISRAALHPSIAVLEVAIVGVRFCGLARGVFRYSERYYSHQVTFRLLAQLRGWFYEAIEPLAPARLLRFRGGDLLARAVGDVETLQHFYVRVLAPPIVALLTSLGMWVFLATFDLRLANALLLFLLLAGVGLPALIYALSCGAGAALVNVRAELAAQVTDGIEGLPELIAFGQQDRYLGHITALGHEQARLEGRLARITGLREGLGALLTNLAVLTVLAIAIPLVATGRLPGVLLAVLALAAAASFEAVAPLPAALQQLGASAAAAGRLFELVDAGPAVATPTHPEPLPPAPASLHVERLRFRYAPGEVPALDSVSLTLAPGELVALVGPSGAGKSTLANVLLRFWDYDEGSITLGGRELRACDPDAVRGRFAVVSQQTHLFNGTVRQNLLVARPDATEDELLAAVRRAHLEEVVAALPQGLETQIGEQGLCLSGGERQRVAIARAFLKDAPFLLLDEPTANLDTATEREVLAAIHELARGRATLLITHRLVGLADAREILVLDRGRVAGRGRESDLLAREGLYRRMWALQRDVVAEGVDVAGAEASASLLARSAALLVS